MNHTVSTPLLIVLTALSATPASAAVVYETDFNDLTVAHTEYPPHPGHDGWYKERAEGDAYGEIQELIANDGRALHEFAPASNGQGNQTIDRRLIDPPVTPFSTMTLSVDFYCASSDLGATNIYEAVFSVWDDTHPGFLMIKFKLEGGNGTPKEETGVKVTLYEFNNDPENPNNLYLPISIGNELAWNTWHHIELIIDYANDEYISVEVDGELEDLSGHTPERSWPDFGQGTFLQRIEATLIPWPWDPPNLSDDDVYWDNLSLTIGGLEGSMYLDGEDFPPFDEQGNPMPVEDPTGQWMELSPDFEVLWNCTDWDDDNEDGIVSPCDYLTLQEEGADPGLWHVEWIGLTIWVKLAMGEPDLTYLEYTGDIEEPLFPQGLYHEVYPFFCNDWECTEYIDVDGSGTLNAGDYLTFIINGEPLFYELIGLATDMEVAQAESQCPADFDGDGDVDTADLLFLLAAWGTPDGDVDGDSDTDTADLLALLAAWGPCP